MEHQQDFNFGPTEISTNLPMASISEVIQWSSVKDAMRASFDFAIRKRDLYPEVIATLSGIPKGTISGLANGSDKALRTHITRPRLMDSLGCMYLHQYEANQLGGLFVRSIDYAQMEREIEQLKAHNDQLIAQLHQRGQTLSPPPAEMQASRKSRGFSIASSDE